MSVATPPGGLVAAAIASARSPASASALRDVRTQHDTGRAKPSTSASSGAPFPRCDVACSPTITTTGVRALAALWRLARPLASPGPRCSRTSAGRSVRRPYASAAPVQTPSNSPRIGRTPEPSSAFTRSSSVVPGFAKQMSSPAAAAVRSRASAPVNL